MVRYLRDLIYKSIKNSGFVDTFLYLSNGNILSGFGHVIGSDRLRKNFEQVPGVVNIFQHSGSLIDSRVQNSKTTFQGVNLAFHLPGVNLQQLLTNIQQLINNMTYLKTEIGL